ncbi:hypothetical protein [Clostridium sporogenes]|uniref:hypothetical protein n=1 Tax=Clostridium sporogenes TaxID=1509 RepID=UPI00214A2320|nr:hypothetical protein [Clostridium sporogenes]MCR1972855.1 hypothetical protein [Clostridium sporogenes]MCW6078250.1 hypothetical protein [Clostridium sporogenes]
MLDERYITYDLKYEADVLPIDNKYGLIEYNKKNATSTINNGILNIKTNAGAIYYKKDNINPNNIILIKTKGKVLSGIWYICEIIDGSKRVKCVACPDKIILCNGQEFHVDMTKEHEIFVIKNKQIDAKVYLDGKLLSTTEQLNENWGNFVGFGNGASETSDDIYIDYFYYNLNFNKDKLDELKYYLIQQNENYYSINNNYIDLGNIDNSEELNNIIDEYGYNDISILTKELNNKRIPTKLENDYYKSFDINLNDIKDNINLIEENDKKYIEYGCNNYKISDKIKEINDGKFEILMKE